MNIEIKFAYSTEDVAKLIIADMERQIGKPPKGHRWIAHHTFCGDYEGYNVEIQKEEVSEEVKA